MHWPNRGFVALLAGAALFISLASCSDDTSDAIGNACQVIIEDCHAGPSMGDCIDSVGELPEECVDCIASHGCDYATCQRLPSGCRIPIELMGK